jgi:hypothetical protein
VRLSCCWFLRIYSSALIEIRSCLRQCVRCVSDLYHAAEGMDQFRNDELFVGVGVENLEYFPEICEELQCEVLQCSVAVAAACQADCHLIR